MTCKQVHYTTGPVYSREASAQARAIVVVVVHVIHCSQYWSCGVCLVDSHGRWWVDSIVIVTAVLSIYRSTTRIQLESMAVVCVCILLLVRVHHTTHTCILHLVVGNSWCKHVPRPTKNVWTRPWTQPV